MILSIYATGCFHNDFTTLKQHYIKTIIVVHISRVTLLCFTRN